MIFSQSPEPSRRLRILESIDVSKDYAGSLRMSGQKATYYYTRQSIHWYRKTRNVRSNSLSWRGKTGVCCQHSPVQFMLIQPGVPSFTQLTEARVSVMRQDASK